jgi:hypothetical protein
VRIDLNLDDRDDASFMGAQPVDAAAVLQAPIVYLVGVVRDDSPEVAGDE